jgi:hypothetical protein
LIEPGEQTSKRLLSQISAAILFVSRGDHYNNRASNITPRRNLSGQRRSDQSGRQALKVALTSEYSARFPAGA